MQLPLKMSEKCQRKVTESEQTRMLFLDFLYNSIVNILPICII